MPPLTIASFNTHGGITAHSDEAYDLARCLDDLDADVVVLQEVWWPDAGRCVPERWATEHGYVFHDLRFGRAHVQPHPRYAGRHNGWIGIAVMTRGASRRVRELALGRAFGDPVAKRRALQVELAEGVNVVGVHNTSRIVHGPIVNLLRLRRQLPPPGTPAVVAGDCNFWGPPVVALLPGWRRAVRARTWPAAKPHSQIDHILVRRDVTVLDGTVLGPTGSDHLPIRATLAV